MDTNNQSNPISELIVDMGSVLIGALFGDVAEHQAKQRKERAANLRAALLAGKRFQLDEMAALLNYRPDLQTVEEIAAEVDLPVILVKRAVKRWFFF